ncbi:hypothetical protein [Frigoribacterium sp. MEB024]|uniref:hypothetical protein n=1 Tax=Frigoribacterium sp. MEB024 TaxID=1589899 RepID=UPI0005BB4105|nr:hypothetical protein [Frigoribacterium sp. MEB024]KIU03859.1 hypothetical protein SZ60_03145 [Frigoribacterium sp. MEB024]
MSESIIAPATDKATAPTSVDALTIIDNAPSEPGTYLTAWKQNGDDWQLSVDYFEHEGRWAVYGVMGHDTSPLTVSKMAEILEAHEDAQGVADHLNNTHALTPVLRENGARKKRVTSLLAAMTVAGVQ